MASCSQHQFSRNLALSHFQDGKLGTAFQGISTIGMKIEDLLRREAKL